MSPVIASIVMVVVVVTALTGAAVWLQQAQLAPIQGLSGIRTTTDTGALTLTHLSGEDVPTVGSYLAVFANGSETRIPLTEFEDQIGPVWEPGEALCLVGQLASCDGRWDDQTIQQVRVISGTSVLHEWTGRVAPEAAEFGAGGVGQGAGGGAGEGGGGGGEDAGDDGGGSDGGDGGGEDHDHGDDTGGGDGDGDGGDHADGDGGTVVCHKPGTPAEQTKTVSHQSLQAHLGHGDTLGPCEGDG